MRWKHRYTVLAILSSAFMVCYLDRMVMASAIPFIAKDLQLSQLAMGAVLSAFFVGYALMQIPGGLLADRFGPRGVLTSSVTWFSIMTAVSATAPGLGTLLAARALFGLGEGPFPPASSKALSRWFPAGELARANGVQLGATGLGATIAPLFVVALISQWGWRSVFYALLVPGLLLAGLVWRYVRNSPAESPRVTQRELAEYDLSGLQPASTTKSFRESLRSAPVLWCAASLFMANLVSWGLMNWLPTYLLQARGFEAHKMGVFAAITNFAGALGNPIGGYLCDRFFSQKLRIPIIWSSILCALFTYLAAVAPSGEWAVFYMVLVFLVSNMSSAAIFTLPLVVVPKHAVGGAFGIVNTAGQIAGVLAPLFIGWILQISHGSFEFVLYAMVALALLAVLPASQIRQPASAELRAEEVA